MGKKFFWPYVSLSGFQGQLWGGATLATIPAPSATLIVLYLTEPYNNIPLATLVEVALFKLFLIFQIGFLNDKNPESKLDAFLDTFDIVLINESSMQLPTTLIKLICDNA